MSIMIPSVYGDIVMFQSGKCSCKKGFHGDQCEFRCSQGHYGKNCEEKCHCNNNQSCDPENGRCYLRCAQGRMGDSCDQSKDTIFVSTVLDICLVAFSPFGNFCLFWAFLKQNLSSVFFKFINVFFSLYFWLT